LETRKEKSIHTQQHKTQCQRLWCSIWGTGASCCCETDVCSYTLSGRGVAVWQVQDREWCWLLSLLGKSEITSYIYMAGMMVTISLCSNYEFKVGKPPTTASAKHFFEQPTVGWNFTFNQSPSLTQDSNYMIVRDPMKFLPVFLKVKKQVLSDGIKE
jgi:hypothetical protein